MSICLDHSYRLKHETNKADCPYCKLETQQAQLRTLAEAVLVAHKGKGGICADCQHVEYGEDYQRCLGGKYDCCKCQACKLAREIMEVRNAR